MSGSPFRTDQPPAQIQRRLPPWFKVTAPGGGKYRELKALLRGHGLQTVCEEARCPNIGECWGADGTATFMILGDTCTRSCQFCAVKKGVPLQHDVTEATRIAGAVAEMGLRHAVVTSVTRDDLSDGGAAAFAATIVAIRRLSPSTSVEVLVPDFGGDISALDVVLEARPDILNHNIETIGRLYSTVRRGADYNRSLALLRHASESGFTAKTGVMVGLGETVDELWQLFDDLVAAGCRILTLGQYLQPTPDHQPIARFYHPDEFASLKAVGEAKGLAHVESGPLVRSSYNAAEQARFIARNGDWESQYADL